MLPATRMSRPGCCLSRVTSSTTLPRKMVEFCQSALSRVRETTYFGSVLIRSAKPASSVLDGQAAANPSYVLRPKSCASAAISSSNLNLSPSGPRLKRNAQPPKGNPSDPPGSSTTPSNVTNSVTTSRMAQTSECAVSTLETSNRQEQNRREHQPRPRLMWTCFAEASQRMRQYRLGPP